MHYRMKGSDQFEASRLVEQACVGKSDREAAAMVKRVIDAAYRSEMDMVKLKEILNGSI